MPGQPSASVCFGVTFVFCIFVGRGNCEEEAAAGIVESVKAQKTKAKRRASAVSPNAFVGKSERPNNDELAEALGPAKALWDELADDLVRENQIDVQEWNSHSPKAG